MEKAPEAFKTISEVAEELDVPQHVLRFWETRFSQIKPMKRGGGRRYYRPNDVDLLKGIRFLLYGKGYTIRGVQRILRENGVADVAAIGRGELSVENFTEKAEPEPRSAKVIRPGAEAEEAEPPAPAQPVLDEAGLGELRTALQELTDAHALLSGAPHEGE
jgi:DNA-binding transcriptional MerR regulator